MVGIVALASVCATYSMISHGGLDLLIISANVVVVPSTVGLVGGETGLLF